MNQYIWKRTGRHITLDVDTIRRYERGRISWPGADYREGLRAVLGVSSEAELGFSPTRRGRAAVAASLSGQDVGILQVGPADCELVSARHEGFVASMLRFPAELDEARAAAVGLWRYQALRREVRGPMPFTVNATTDAGWRWLGLPPE
ncbi:hypothetical protein [Myceligenerans salitolerans]|uniref:Uncharacterized protein n=1 Tax=Myceligenerans salitolerans TaxID=1230528 RepID=A0ABS3I7L4_9MICO|nr:hypothetical protein [Myceligenerans salitolerans]MBO0608988.1 hypothetical protein [Myceligenerans salitolerans]